MGTNNISRYPPVLPDIRDWPIYQLSRNRENFLQSVEQTAFQKIISRIKDPNTLADEIAKTLYQERIRLTQQHWKADPPDEKAFWSEIKKQFINIPVDELAAYREQEELLVKKIIHRYALEIQGNFDPSVYEFARRLVPIGFSRLLKTSAGRNLIERWSGQLDPRDKIHIHGDIQTLRELAKTCTLIMVPTHFSNIDSILIGWAIQDMGLPPFIYGAGLNLFGIKILAFFMNRLGAYKVDRRKKNVFYLNTLKTYSSLAIQFGCHSLFFPGGTRSRSGAIETHLKLGLMGTAMEAQYYNYLKDGPRARKIVVVPVVTSYNCVLEAPVLIEDYLKRTGRELYLEVPDLYSTSFKMIKFIWKFLREGSEIALNVGPCMDLFGNPVTADGTSHDPHGRPVDVMKYFQFKGELRADEQRDSEYVKRLGEIIIDTYHRQNIAFASHLVAFVAFELLRKKFRQFDIFRLVRLPLDEAEIPYDQFEDKVAQIRNLLLDMERNGKIHVASHMKGDLQQVIDFGLKQVGIFHALRPLYRKDENTIASQDLKLLYYYHNRMTGYDIEKYI